LNGICEANIGDFANQRFKSMIQKIGRYTDLTIKLKAYALQPSSKSFYYLLDLLQGRSQGRLSIYDK
jgi:hypothetical protein